MSETGGTHDPAVHQSIERTVAPLEDCAEACRTCATQADASGEPALAGCASTCRACAAVCDATVAVLREEPWDRLEIVIAQARSAYEASRSCAGECAAHDPDFCQRCASACARARDATKALLADIEDTVAPAAPALVRDVPRGDEEE